MDRAHRHELKHDKFIEQVGSTVEYAAAHKRQLILYTALAFAALFIALGVSWYMRSQAAQRQDALRAAVRYQEAQIGPTQSEFVVSFATEQEKQEAAEKAWSDLVTRYPRSDEAAIAHFYMGVNAADRGQSQEAEKHLQAAIETGKEPYVSQARLSLAHVYHGIGRTEDAEKLLRAVVDNPTILVSKEQATIDLAKVIARTKPDEARKLLEPLRTERSAVSRAALTALSEIPAAPAN